MKNKIITDITGCIGKTPLVYMDQFTGNSKNRIAAKLEFMNPAGSVKDRIVLNIINDAEKRGLLARGATIIESTSGNTGIALAAICAVKGYKLMITMPDTMSQERRKILRAYGAELVITPGENGMLGAIQKAEALKESIPGAFLPQQFNNISNPEAHFKSTAIEIWNDTAGLVDCFVAGIGTGGTITGVGRYLRKKNPSIKIIGVEPAGSPTFSGGNPGEHKIQGIGPGFIPNVYDSKLVDGIFTIDDEEAAEMTRRIARETGFFVGISSGAVMAAAIKVNAANRKKCKLIVVVFPDNGYKYLDTGLFE